MKHILCLIITGAIAFSFTGKPFAYYMTAMDTKGMEVAKLAKATATIQTKGKKNSINPNYVISGAKSVCRLKINQTSFQCYSEQSTEGLNPAHYLVLYKLTVGKSSRTFAANDNIIPFTISNLTSLNCKIFPATGLVRGEYAFVDKSTTTADGNVTVSTFGVD